MKSAREMADRTQVADAAALVAAAIGRRDEAALRELLMPDFVHRTLGGASVTLDAFLAGVRAIPGVIQTIALESLQVDLFDDHALATGTQYAKVTIDGQVIEDRRGFVDCFVKDGARWRIRAAVDVPPAAAS